MYLFLWIQKKVKYIRTPDTTFSLTDNYSDLTGLLPELAAGVALYAAGNVLLINMNAIGKPIRYYIATMVAG